MDFVEILQDGLIDVLKGAAMHMTLNLRNQITFCLMRLLIMVIYNQQFQIIWFEKQKG